MCIRDRYKRVPVKKGSYIQDYFGRACHLASKLFEHLIEYRHNFCDQDDYYKDHHEYHDKRISDRILNGLGQ